MRVNQIPHVRLNNYQLDKRKKQWALLSATVLTALSAGLASAHAADQPTAVLTAPTTAAVPTPAVSSAGMSTRSQPAAESIAANSASHCGRATGRRREFNRGCAVSLQPTATGEPADWPH